jgi:aryl-alcohol dehydrogenase-like predicted oxidoreductase
MKAAAVPSARLALGTVQFGLPYGITHAGGRVPEDEVGAILADAQAAGIDLLDTAAAYGDSEAVLGRRPEARSFAVITKTLPLRRPAIGPAEIDAVARAFDASLARLGRDHVEGLLVHDAADLLVPGGAALWAMLEARLAAGQVRRLGVSVYDRAALDAVVARFPLALVQLPLNALDQRLDRDGTLALLAANGIAVHVRSAFLQGLLLGGPVGGPAAVPPGPAAAAPFLRRWHAAVAAAGTTAAAAALAYVATRPGVERVVIGVHSRAHLAAAVAAFAARPVLEWAALACDDPDVVDPRRWKEQGG